MAMGTLWTMAPALMLPYHPLRAMDEKNIDVRDHFPKGLLQFVHGTKGPQFDLIINMSGFDLPPDISTPVRHWDVPDPIGVAYETHCHIRDEIERLVMDLILELRRAGRSAAR